MTMPLTAGERTATLVADAVQEDEDMNVLRQYSPFEAVPTIVKNWPVGAGFTTTVTGGKLNVTQAVAGADKMCALNILTVAGTDGEGASSAWHTAKGKITRKLTRLGCYIGPTLMSNPDGRQRIGIALSYHSLDPPYLNPMLSDFAFALLAFYPLTSDFRLTVCRGENQPETETILTGVDAYSADYGFYLELQNDPYTDTLSAFVNGDLGLAVTGSNYPRWDYEIHDNGWWANVFMDSGSHASARVGAVFAHLVHSIYDPHGAASAAHP